MKYVVVFLLSTIMVLAQQPTKKVTEEVSARFELAGAPSQKVLVWVYFSDKGPQTSGLAKSTSLVTDESLARRAKVLPQSQLTDQLDVPLYQPYLDKVGELGISVKQFSKWFNSISAYVTADQVKQLAALDFVTKVDAVKGFVSDRHAIKTLEQVNNEDLPLTGSLNKVGSGIDYGLAAHQNAMLKVPVMHQMGYTGKGVIIALMDAGVDNLAHEVFASMNIIAKYDFVNNDPEVGNQNDLGEGSHGTLTLSTIGGNKPGTYVGPAFGATYIIAKTENTASETNVEEDNWVRAMEWADSLGAMLTSTSLGYLGMDAGFTSYTYLNMDGNTAIITKAGDIAAAKGIVVVNSAGNEGFDANHNTLGAPSDGFNVIAVGSVDSSGMRSSFSSVGNTIDGRTKPDIMAQGTRTWAATSWATNSYGRASGTSLSCPLAAGAIALLMERFPTLTPVQVRDAIRSTATNASAPDREYGWGIINLDGAVNKLLNNEVEVGVPEAYAVSQNYPNPFNPSTTIDVSLPVSGITRVTVYSVLGEEVATILNEYKDAGNFSLRFNADGLPSGNYIYRIVSGEFTHSGKMTLMK